MYISIYVKLYILFEYINIYIFKKLVSEKNTVERKCMASLRAMINWNALESERVYRNKITLNKIGI